VDPWLGHWTTKVGWAEAGTILVRGYRAEELIRALTFAEAATRLPARVRTVVTGNPVREEILAVTQTREALAAQAHAEVDLEPRRRTVVVFGGSQGALHVNMATVDALSRLRDRDDLQVLVLAGASHEEDVRGRLGGLGGQVLVRVRGFLDRMELAYAVADLVVARAGATTCAEVAVVRTTGRVHVKRVVLAQDEGVIVNPEGSRQQIEGGITMGLGYALTEHVRFKGGEVLDRNFDTYEIPRFSWVPKIEAILIENPGVPASGCGEPPIVGMGAVIANAIFDAIGVRFPQLPMTPARIKAALK